MKKIARLAILTLLPFVALLEGCGPGDNKVYSGSVTTFAGAAGIASAVDGTSTMARFNLPTGITLYGTKLYIADSGNNTIRKIDISASGIPVTTLAGVAPFSGPTDGPGATARFFNPSGITTDSTNLYVADTFNHTIRGIDISASGVPVSTLAGAAGFFESTDGTGAAARFNNPFGIVSNGIYPGNILYVADTSNSIIRRIDPLAGVVGTIAGNAASSVGVTDGPGTDARFNKPSGITTDGIYLYVADTSNHTIRKIDVSSSTADVTTVAGSATIPGAADGIGAAATFNLPAGILWSGGILYVADTGNHTIRQIILATGVVTTLAGAAGIPGTTDGTGSAARFKFPTGITTDGASLYVTDTYNHTIRRIQ